MTAWSAYRVVLRLHSPMHIGYTTVGYLQRTRPYVTGRVLRGALVSRVARNPNTVGDDPRDPYRRVGITFYQYMAFTYFYPALKENGEYRAKFPWKDESLFRHHFLSSYAGTALSYPEQSAAEGLLREIEYISPHTRDGQQVYLMGYMFIDEAHIKAKRFNWPRAFRRLQLGGERGYGWGVVRMEKDSDIMPLNEGDNIFDGVCELYKLTDTKRPILHLGKDASILAHAQPLGAALQGRVEPMVGREWRADNDKRRKSKRTHIGQHIAFDGVYFVPGSRVTADTWFAIGKGGYWYPQKGAAP